MARITWVGQDASARSSNVENLTLVNVYPEIVESKQGKCPVALYGTPGLRALLTLAGFGAVRNMHVTADGRLFVVRGNTLSEIFPDNVQIERGTINTTTGLVSFADNGLTLLLVDGPYAYTYTYATDTFAALLDGDFLGASHTGFLDGYYLFLRPQSQQFYWSSLYSTAIDAADIASAEGHPDLLVAMLVAHREIWLFGRYSTEVWYSTGGDPPFARIQGALLEHGCAAPQSPAVVAETLCWLAQDKAGHCQVVQTQGMQATRISTHDLESTLQDYAAVADAVGWSYQQHGHEFYVLTFPSAQVAHVYDMMTGLWHRRQSIDLVTGFPSRPRPSCHAFAHGRHYIGDYASGQVYILDDEVYTDAGVVIPREITLPPMLLPDNLGRVFIRALQIDAEVGIGLDGTTNPGSNPQIHVSYSDDGGHIFTAGHFIPMGRIGRYRHRAKVRRLGSSRDRRFKLRFTDPCKFVILGAYVDIEGASV